MSKITNIHDLIIGCSYEITYPCYDDYDEKLKSEIENVKIVKKLRDSFLALNIETEDTHEIKFQILKECQIVQINSI